MKLNRLALPALLVALAILFVPACGGEETDDTDQATKPAAGTPSAETSAPDAEEPEAPAAETPEKKLWTLNVKNLREYGAAFKDLRENAPRVLEDATSNALTMAKANDGLTFGNKATKVLETHGLTPEQFKHFGGKLWPAVIAVAPEQASQAGGLAALAGDHAKSLEGAANEALKEYTKNVTADDKAFVQENLDEILALLK
jgi:hypothetical protein